MKVEEKGTCVYKFYNSSGKLMYIGITDNHEKRFYKHSREKEWFKEVSNIKISKCMNRNEAHIYEIYYISKLKPIHNEDFNKTDCNDFKIEIKDLIFNDYSFHDKEFKTNNISINSNIIKLINPYSCKLLLCLMNYKDIDGFIRINKEYPHVKEICESINMPPSTYKKAMKELKDFNLVEVTRKTKYSMIYLCI